MRSIVSNTLFAAASAALTAGALLFSVPASASTLSRDPLLLVRQTNVSYADLDLTSETGRATLQHRIHIAAERVCIPRGDGVLYLLNEATCRKDSLAKASRRMDLAIAKANAQHVALR